MAERALAVKGEAVGKPTERRYSWNVEVRTASGGTLIRHVVTSLPSTARNAENHVRRSLKRGQTLVGAQP